ncbi:hypothetical protein NC651_039574 [Populus alba x Populus x berolinensis]|nr:hypothetical protein NC651_039574 [Populus alba x Populus x berolinensis]
MGLIYNLLQTPVIGCGLCERMTNSGASRESASQGECVR